MTPTAMPTWLRSMLEAQGFISAQGLTRTARIRACRGCRVPVVAGIDNNGLDAWDELGELHATGEALALVDRRRTHWIHAGQLVARDQWTIRARPAGASGTPPVFAEHRCHQPVPADWQQPYTPDPTPTPIASEEIPF